jgi:hypothetical protein
MMKYEATQQQYVDFLNTLTRIQQNNRTGTDLSILTVTSVTNRYVMSNSSTRTNRNGIRCDATISDRNEINFYCDYNGNGTGGEAADGQWIACNFLSQNDVWAYQDWSGLRFMTDLEYEKTCRGSVFPVPDEFAWGTTNITPAVGINNEGLINEGPSNTDANCNSNNSMNTSLSGPMRVGCFAGAATTREQSGASYYGVMNLSDNLREVISNIAHTSFSSPTYFTIYSNGNGMLNRDGNQDWAGGTQLDYKVNAVKGNWSQSRAQVCNECDRSPAGGYGRNNANGMRFNRTFPTTDPQ